MTRQDREAAIAARIGSTRVQARKELSSLAHWEPGKALVLARAAITKATQGA